MAELATENKNEKKQPRARWYIVHVHSGQEIKVAKNIELKFKGTDKEGFFEEIYVPIEKYTEVKNNERKELERRFFPGYVLVKVVMNDDSWQAIKSVPKVTGFLGAQNGARPSPVPQKEIDEIKAKVEEGVITSEGTSEYCVGDTVSVIDGPFASFSGTIEDVSEAKRMARISVSIFGRVTPVELEFNQIRKES